MTLRKMKPFGWSLLLGALVLTACTKDDNFGRSREYIIDPVEPASGGTGDVPEDAGGKYSERIVSINRNGVYGGQVKLRFYESMPNVPYISARDFHQMMIPGSSMVINKTGGLYELMTEDGYALINVYEDTFKTDQFEDFTNMMALTQRGMPNVYYDGLPAVRYKSWQNTPAQAEVSFDFRAYEIDLFGDWEGVYLPFTTLSDLYSDQHYNVAGWNGERIVINTTPDKGTMAAVDPSFSAGCYQRESIPADLAEYRYKELCFVIDFLYGRTGRSPYEPTIIAKGINAVLEADDKGRQVRQLLNSTKTAEFAVGMEALQSYIDDGGHTIIIMERHCPAAARPVFKPRYDAARAAYPQAAKMYDDWMEGSKPKSQIRTDMKALREKMLGKEFYYKKGNTALCVLRSFVDLEWDAWYKYYAGGEKPTIEKYPNDDLLILLEGMRKADADPEVKNLVIDITTNGGGSDDVVNLLESLITNDCRSWNKNTLTGQQRVITYEADRNLDGRIDDKDRQVKYNLNFAVLTSGFSFSCANIFPAVMKDHGILLIGEKTGGGGCSIQQMVTADGLDYHISSFRSLSTNDKWQSIDGGVEPHHALDRKNHPEAFFDLEVLGKIIDNYYKK